MAEKGGSSTATGVDFEAWIAAGFLSEAILDDAVSVKLQAKMVKDLEGKEEKPFIDDIVVFRKDRIEFYDCKYRAPKAGEWTYTYLKEYGILDRLKNQYIENPDYELFFATESPSPLIAEAFQRSSNSETPAEARKRLNDGGYEADWDKTKGYLAFPDKQMLEFTKRVKLYPANLAQLQRDIIYRLKPYITMVDTVPVLLKDLALEGAKRGRRIYGSDIIDYLKVKGVNLKSSFNIDDIIRDFEVASASLSTVRSVIGRNISIPRDETKKLMEWIENQSNGKKAACLIGAMGVGKTVIMHELYKELTSKSIPVLAVKADCYSHIKTSQELSGELGLKDDFLKLVATTAETKSKCVVIFDQLDALSDSLSKDRTALNIIINSINNLTAIPDVNVIISCRKFDLDYDQTLSQMEFDSKIEVQPLSADKAKEAIGKLGIQPEIFTEKQIELFCIPLHLYLLSEIYESEIAFDTIQTLQDLYGRLWDKVIIKGSDKQIENKINAIYKLVDWMDSNKELTAPLPILDDLSNARKELLSNGIFVSTGSKKLGFFHQSLFDYCFARRFTADNKSLTEKILKEHQGLFVRSQIKQTLSFLRGADTSRYIKELKALLTSEKLRYHLKDLIISLLGSQPEPNKEEGNFVREIFQHKNPQLRDHFIRNVSSPAWFDILNKDYIEPLIREDEKIISLIMSFYLKILNYRTKEIFSLLEELPEFPNKGKWCNNFLWNLENWCDEAIEFYKRMRSQANFREEDVHLILEKMYKKRKNEAFYLLIEDLDSKIEELKTDPDKINGKKGLIDWDFLDIFKKASKDIPEIANREIAIRLKRIIELTKFEDKRRFYRDRAFYLYEQGDGLYPIWQLLNEFAWNIKTLIRNGTIPLIKEIVALFHPSSSVTLNRILCWIYTEAPAQFIKEAYELLSIPEALLEINGGHISGYDARNLLIKIFQNFNDTQRQNIEDAILQVDPEWEREAGSQKYRGHSQYIALSAIPEEYRSEKASKRFAELERKFGKISEEKPKPMEMESVGSPIPDNVLQKMNLEQWLNAFTKYDDDTSWNGSKRHFLKGGVIELSRAFKEVVKSKPDDFYEFVLTLEKENVSFDYISQAISGFTEAGYDYQKMKTLILRYAACPDNGLRRSIISAIEKLDKREPIDSELLGILSDYAINDPNPDRELYKVKAESGHYYYGGDALNYGINTVRGSAAMAITHHGFRTGDSNKVFEILEKITEDPFISVRSCLIPDLAGMLKWDRKRAFEIYKKALRDMGPELLSISGRFLGYALSKDNFKDIIPYLRQMALIETENANKSVGHIAMVAVLRKYQDSEKFLEEMLTATANIRKGIADICMEHITDEDYKEQCKNQLNVLFDSYSEDIGDTIAWYLHRMEVKDFNIIYPLIEKLSNSTSSERELHFTIEYLLKCVPIYPEECIDLMLNFVYYQAHNIQPGMSANESAQIITGAYLKTSKDDYKEKAMNVLDKMHEKGFYSVRKLVEDLDR